MPIPDTVLGAWRQGGRTKKEVSDFEVFGEKLIAAAMENGKSVVAAVRAIEAPRVQVETKERRPVAYRSRVTKRDDEGRILEIVHEPIKEMMT